MLTEVEMREFFQQVVDQVATLSTQASQVEGLRSQVSALQNQVATLASEVGELHRQLQDAKDANSKLEELLRNEQHARNAADEHAVALRDTIVQRDTKVTELTNQVSQEVDSHRITRADLEDARRATAEWESKYKEASDNLSDALASRDEWRTRADTVQRSYDEIRAKLDRVTSIVNPPELRVVADVG